MNVEIYTHMACGFCWRAKELLDDEDIPYTEINLMQDQSKFAEMVERTGRRSVPQILINGQPIGGFTELAELRASGELARLLGQDEEN